MNYQPLKTSRRYDANFRDTTLEAYRLRHAVLARMRQKPNLIGVLVGTYFPNQETLTGRRYQEFCK